MMFLEALKLKYEAEMSAAKANLSVYMNSSVGIGEHPDIVEAVETQVRRYNEAKEMYGSIVEMMKWFEFDEI